MLHHDSDGAFTYIDRDGRIALVRPRLGLTGNDEVEVLDGLAPGDQVVSSLDQPELADGRAAVVADD